MYACESLCFQKEERRKKVLKSLWNYVGAGLLFVVILFILFFLIQVFLYKAPEKHTLLEEETITPMQDLSTNTEEYMENGTQEDLFMEDNPENVTGEYMLEEPSEIPLIVIDPGHGGMDEGCSREGEEEKTYNLELALMLKTSLEEAGFRVLLTRTEDIEVGLAERVQIAVLAKADLFISIHQNASEYPEAEGIETWYYADASGDNKRLASLVQKYVIQNTETNSRGIQETDSLYVIRECGMPACLVETGFLSNDKDFEKLKSEEYHQEIVKGLTEAVWYYFNPKKMYLTFDDGPSKENTVRILEVLKERNIQATFFVVGENVEKYPDIIKRIVEDGHSIGIHCYSHSYEDIYQSVEDFVEDFERAKEAVQKIVDVEVWCYRFPGGSINSHNKYIYEDIIAEMSEMGYLYYDWNASMEDALKNVTKEQIIQSAVESTLGRKKVVMLGHDIVYNTSVCIEELIDSFPEYEFLPLTKEVTPIIFKP